MLDLGPRASGKFSRTMKELERNLGATYSNSCQPSIMTETPYTFPNPEMPTIIPDMGVENTKTDVEMTYLKNKSIDEAILQKPRKKNVYETDMQNIYNLIMKLTITGEGGIVCHLIGGQDKPRPHWVPDDY